VKSPRNFESHSGQERRAVLFTRWAFGGLIVVFFTQYLVALLINYQPYPGLYMPAFTGTGGYQNGVVNVDVLEAVFISRNGNEYSFRQQELLGEFPDSLHGKIAELFLSPPRDASDAALESHLQMKVRLRCLMSPGHDPDWLVTKLRHGPFPGLFWANVHRDAAETRWSLRQWFARRAEALAPGADIEFVDCVWSRMSYTIRSGQPSVLQSPLGKTRIALKEST
jgi:hypothetical protein